MTTDGMRNKVQKVTEKDLPLTIEDVSKVDLTEGRESLGMFVLTIGTFIVIYGIYLFLFGPDSIRVGYSGPTFFEYLQLNPHYIILVGAFTLAFGNAMKQSAIQKTKEYIDKNYALYNASGEPTKDATLVGSFNEEDYLVLEYHQTEPSDESV